MNIKNAIIHELKNGPKTPRELSKSLGVPLTIMARHLQMLEGDGLVRGKIEVAGNRAGESSDLSGMSL